MIHSETHTVKCTVQISTNNTTIVWSVWLNGWVFIYELNGCAFEFSCSHLIFRIRACFEQGFPWHSGNYRDWIHFETLTWHDSNIQSKYFSLGLILIKLQSRYPFKIFFYQDIIFNFSVFISVFMSFFINI